MRASRYDVCQMVGHSNQRSACAPVHDTRQSRPRTYTQSSASLCSFCPSNMAIPGGFSWICVSVLFGLAPSGVALNKIRLLRIISPVCVNSRSFDTRFQTNILSHHQRQHRSTNERARARQETERQLLLCDIAIAFVAIIRRQHSAVKCHRLHASSRSNSKQSAEKARNSSSH